MTVRLTISISDEVAALLDAEAERKRAERRKTKKNVSEEISDRVVRTLLEDGLLPKEGAESKNP